MAVGIYWEALWMLLGNDDFQLVILTFAVSVVLCFSLMYTWKLVKEVRR